MKKEEDDKIYNELRKHYTDEEIAESFVFSIDMTEDERIELREVLKEHRDNMTEKDAMEIGKFSQKLKNLSD